MDNNYSISCYLSIYNDFDFIENILDKINDYINEIIIVDGPYNYCLTTLKDINYFYDETNLPLELEDFIKKYGNKVKYFYGIWNNEKEKRMFGYDKCSSNYVLIVDSDEFYHFDITKLNNFINSDKYVAGFEIYNMNRYNTYFDHLVKNILFLKSKINAHQHLSYTWLWNVDNLEESNNLYIYNDTVGTIYHQTLNRTKKYTIMKYIFYISLWYTRNNKDKNFGIDINKIKKIFNYDDIYDIIYRLNMDYINIQPINKILRYIENPLIDLSKYSNNHNTSYFTSNLKVLNNIRSHFCINKEFIKNGILNLTFETNNIIDGEMEIFEIIINEASNNHKISFTIIDDKFSIDLNIQKDIFECCIRIICNTKGDYGIITTINNNIQE